VRIHEYQAKQLLGARGLPVPLGIPVFAPEAVEPAAREVMQRTGGTTVVVKAQIHAGGRGKGGGIAICTGAQAVHEAAARMLGMRLVTRQTGPAGRTVKRLLLEAGVSIARELYAGLLVDRSRGRVVVVASAAGGMDIEEVAARHPHAILARHMDPALGLAPHQARELSHGLGLAGRAAAAGAALLHELYAAFVALDASLIEVNPLVLTPDDELLALDCKMTIDDNALFRQPEVAAMRDLDEEHPSEAQAREHGLSFIKLDGSIGCMVNGAGLAMATMDIIEHFGASPANFLDVGGGASRDKVSAAFRILSADPAVRAIFVNIVGGIVRCDLVAEGLLAALAGSRPRVPLVVRLAGTNVERGSKLLADSGLAITTASDMADGARKAAALAAGKAD
jgi:succinyl-CoA synthetase beta subunit